MNLSEHLLLLRPRVRNTYDMNVSQLSVANQEFNHLENSKWGAYTFRSFLSDEVFRTMGIFVIKNAYSRDCVCSGMVFRRRSFSEMLPHSYRWRWENLETFLHTSWLVLSHPSLYNSSFGKDNPRLVKREDKAVTQS